MTTGTTTTTTAANDWARTFTATVQTAENSPRQHDHMMGSPALQPELHPRQNGTSNARLVPSLSAKSLGAGRSSFTGAIQALKGYVGRRGDAKLSKDTECRSVDVSRAGPNPANPLFPSFSVDIKRANSESDLSGRARRASMLRSSTRSLKGRKHPERENQDEFFSVPDLFQLHPNSAPPPPQATFGPVGIFGVCDGHGGGRCSAFVSKHLPVHLAASSAWARLSDPSTSACGGNGHACAASTDGDIRPCCRNSDRTGGEGEGALPLVPKVMREALVDGFRRTDGAFSKFAEAHKDNSGSTAVVAMVCNPWVVIANVGDSSALFYNDNAWVARNGAKSARTKVCCCCSVRYSMYNYDVAVCFGFDLFAFKSLAGGGGREYKQSRTAFCAPDLLECSHRHVE